MKLKDFISAGFSSLLLILAFPNYNFWPFAWFGMIPLFIAIHNKTPLQSFWLGWAQGILFYLGTLSWIINTMVNYGRLPLSVSIFLLIVLALYLGAYTGLFCFFLSCFSHPKVHKWLAASFIWVSLEYVRAHFLTGFPWASLAYSQFNFLSVIQIVDITGIYGLSFLFVLFDIEVIFLLPYAVVLRKLGLFGLIEMLVFVMILLVGYVYVWKKGALEWE